jgi:hypothetical protein
MFSCVCVCVFWEGGNSCVFVLPGDGSSWESGFIIRSRARTVGSLVQGKAQFLASYFAQGHKITCNIVMVLP